MRSVGVRRGLVGVCSLARRRIVTIACVRGRRAERATRAYERERERMIQVLKLTQAWLNTPADDEPPSDLFRGLLRMGASGSSASSE